MKSHLCLARIAVMLLVALMGAPVGAQGPVRLGLDWIILAQHTPYVIAQEKGYWKEAGLDVQVSRGWGSADGVRRLVSGASDIVFADPGFLAIARAKAKPNEPKAKAIAILYGKAPFAIYSKKKTGIAQPKNLEGKTIGAPPFDGIRKVFPAFAKHVGIDTRQVKWIDVDPAAKTPMVIADRIDAATNFLFERVTWRKKFADIGGVDVMFFYDYGFNVYGNGLMAREKDIEGEADVVRKVTQGVIRGYRYTLDHLEESAALFAKKYPTQDPTIIREVVPILKELVLTPEVMEHCIGWIDDAIMARTTRVMLDAYGVTEPLDPRDTYTRAFLPCK